MRRRERWLTKYWRPMIAYQYLVVCLFDFLFGPILYAYIQSGHSGFDPSKIIQWAPLTLQGGGLYHLAMGAIITGYAYGRTMEKLQMMKSKTYGDDFVRTEIESLGNQIIE